MSIDVRKGTYEQIKAYEPSAVVGETFQNIITGQLYTCFEAGVLTPIKSLAEVPGSTSTTVYWNNIEGKPNTFTPSTHTHPATGNVTEVDGGNL